MEDIIIDRNLPYDATTAIGIISNAIEKPRYELIQNWGLEGSSYQGIVTNTHFKIWTREPRRGPAPAFVEGDILPLETKSRIIAQIKILSFNRPFKFNPIVLTLLALFSFISFIFAMIWIMTAEKMLAYLLAITFPIFMVSIFLTVMALINYKARQEQEELSNFIDGLFPVS